MVLQDMFDEIAERPEEKEFLKYVGKPEIDMMQAYCGERGLEFDAQTAKEKFYSTYTREAERMTGEMECPGEP